MPSVSRTLALVFVLLLPTQAVGAAVTTCAEGPAAHDPWAAIWQSGPEVNQPAAPRLPLPDLASGGSILAALRAAAAEPSPARQEPAQATLARPVAFEYSDAYQVRRRIHFYASFATIPLFVAQYYVGDQLYDGTGDSGTKSLHSGLAAGTAVLFGVNSVTGVWNLLEARKDPNNKTKRTLHGILMLAADAGFLATAMLAPDSEDEGGEIGAGEDRDTHRNVAIASMGIATVSYVIMLVGR